MTESRSREPFVLGPWTVQPSLHRLRHRDGTERTVEPKAVRVLTCLAARPGEVVSRDELLEAAWPGEHVTEYVLSRSISALRKALGDDHKSPSYIETIRKGGFRLVAPVSRQAGAAAEPAAAVLRRGIRSRWLVAGAVAVLAVGAALARKAWEGARETGAAGLPRPLTSFQGSELDPVLSPDGKHLAFTWSGPENRNFDVYVKALDEEAPARRTDHPAEDKNPAWSPDGERIAFVRSSENTNGIFVVPLVGGAERQLADCVSGDIPDLVWSADGRYLFFPDRDAPDEPSGIFRLDVESRERRRLTRPPGHVLGDRDLTVSPDGTEVAFARALMPGIEDLYVASVDGETLRRLTFDGCSINGLEWLPESSDILFSSQRDGTSRLWRIPAAGGVPRPLLELGDGVFDPSIARHAGRLVYERKVYDTNIWAIDLGGAAAAEPRIASTRWDSAPAFSPDGRRIAFVSDRSGPAEVWACDRDGSNPLRVTGSEGSVASPPDWSPEGASLVYAAQRGAQSDLFLVAASGGEPSKLTSSTWSEVQPAFSRDGRSIYYGSDQTGRWQIWRIPVDGGEPVQVTRSGGLQAREARDGQHVYYSRQDRPGIWRVPAAGGSEVLLFEPREPVYWSDWTLVEDRVYFRNLPPNPVVPSSVFAYDVPAAALELVVAELPGRSSPGLGIAVAGGEDLLLAGTIDRSDGDIMLVEGFR